MPIKDNKRQDAEDRRRREKGIDKHGNKKANYEPGVSIRAKVTVFGEGVRGSLTKSLILSPPSVTPRRAAMMPSAARRA